MFIYKNNQLEVDPNIVAAIPPIRRIWDRDQTENKEQAMALLSFLYLNYNPKSPFRKQYTVDECPIEIIKQTFPISLVKWTYQQDKTFQDAVKFYINYLDLAPERILMEDAERAIYELSTKLRESKTKNKEAILAKVKDAITDLRYLRALVKEEEEKKEATRGNRVVLAREDPDYKPMFVPKLPTREPLPFDE